MIQNIELSENLRIKFIEECRFNDIYCIKTCDENKILKLKQIASKYGFNENDNLSAFFEACEEVYWESFMKQLMKDTDESIKYINLEGKEKRIWMSRDLLEKYRIAYNNECIIEDKLKKEESPDEYELARNAVKKSETLELWRTTKALADTANSKLISNKSAKQVYDKLKYCTDVEINKNGRVRVSMEINEISGLSENEVLDGTIKGTIYATEDLLTEPAEIIGTVYFVLPVEGISNGNYDDYNGIFLDTVTLDDETAKENALKYIGRELELFQNYELWVDLEPYNLWIMEK